MEEKILDDYMSWDGKACINLACAILSQWATAYKEAYLAHLSHPDKITSGRLRRFEANLKGPLAGLDDSQLKYLQKQALQKQAELKRAAKTKFAK